MIGARTYDILSIMKPTQTLYKWAAQIVHYHNHRATRLNAFGKLAVRDWIDCLKCAKGTCSVCNQIVGWWSFELDHIIALACGGTNMRANIRAICRSCNRRKRHAPITIAESPDYCTSEEARDVLGWKIETIHKAIRRGDLSGIVMPGICFVRKSSIVQQINKWKLKPIKENDIWPENTAVRK